MLFWNHGLNLRGQQHEVVMILGEVLLWQKKAFEPWKSVKMLADFIVSKKTFQARLLPATSTVSDEPR
jgi:hypothetical protein